MKGFTMSPAEIEAHNASVRAEAIRCGDIKVSNENYVDRKIPNTELECEQRMALVETLQGEAKSIPRVVVRFTGYRVRPLDPDNFAGSVKDLLDGLRHAGLIPGDEAWRIKLETEQEKVGHYAAEKTLIEIETL